LLNFVIVSDTFLEVDHFIFDGFKGDSSGINSELNESVVEVDFDLSLDSEERWDGSSDGKTSVSLILDSGNEGLELSCQLRGRETKGGSEVL